MANLPFSYLKAYFIQAKKLTATKSIFRVAIVTAKWTACQSNKSGGQADSGGLTLKRVKNFSYPEVRHAKRRNLRIRAGIFPLISPLTYLHNFRRLPQATLLRAGSHPECYRPCPVRKQRQEPYYDQGNN